MIKDTLHDLITAHQNGDKYAITRIITKMTTLMQKYVKLLKDEDSISDFYFCLLNIVTTINIDNFCGKHGEYKLLSYIKKKAFTTNI